MKTTKKSALAKRIQKLVDSKELNKNSLVYRWIENLYTGDVIRPVFTQGSSWKHSSLVDKSKELEIVLMKLKIGFVAGNDSPRGGRTGYFVKITTKIDREA